MTPKSSKLSPVARLAFVLGGLATLILVGALLWAGFTAPMSSRMPVPSPDGRYFAYFNRTDSSSESESSGFDLIISSPEGQLLARLSALPGRIIWSNANHLVTLDAGGSQATIIANAGDRFVQLARLTLRRRANPQWASDGNKLACLRQLEAGQQLTIYDVQQPQTFPVSLPADFRLNDARLIAWSPGSEQLYFLNSENKEAVLYEIGVRSGIPRELARGRHSAEGQLPEMSPDGRRIYWGPPENTIIDVQTGTPLWKLPAGAQALWRPWSREGHEFYFARKETPETVFGHNFLSSSEQPVISGVKDNGFFELDGIDYFFRDLPPVAGSASDARVNLRQASPSWWQAGSMKPHQPLEGIELWPWEQTLDGFILARRDEATRVQYGLFDPETHRLDAYTFPTDVDDYLRQIKSYRVVIATVVLFTILAGITLAKRSQAKSGRAFPILLFLTMALGCGVMGSTVWIAPRIIPYRITLAEIGNQGWGISSSLPQVVFRQAQMIMTWLWALLPLAILNFGIDFPERTPFLKSRSRVKWVLLGIATIPVLVTAWGRFDPALPPAVSRYVVIATVAVAACVWALSLDASYQQPPDKAARRAVVWFVAALTLLAAAYVAHLIIPHGATGFWGAPEGKSQRTLQLTFFVLAAWVAPSGMAYAVVARKPVGLGRFFSSLFRQVLMGIPALAGFTLAWVVGSLVVSGSFWAFSPLVIVIAVLFAVLSVLPFRGRLRVAIDRKFDRARFESRERLAEFARSLPHTVDREALARQLEEAVTRAMQARWCLLLVPDRGSRTLSLQPGKTALSPEMRRITFNLDEPLCVYLKGEDSILEPLLASSADDMEGVMASAGERLRKLQAEVVLGIHRLDLLGLIILGPRTTGELYDSEELVSLRFVARETAAALENIDLFEMAARDRETRKELELAADIQAKLFPAHVPKLTAGQLTGCCYPARTVGGDYYDFVNLPGRKIGLIMCDVPGKGMAAALQAASLEKILGSQIPAATNLAEMIQKVNDELIASSGEGKVSTLFYGVFDDSTRRLEYINAGHPPPLLITAETSQFLDSTGFPLGLFAEISHQSRSVFLPPGAMLLVYSDGAVDARNVSGETFGRQRLAGTLYRDLESDADRALSRVVAEIRDFEGDALLEDDQTFILLKVYPK